MTITPEQMQELRTQNIGRLFVRAFRDFQMRCTQILESYGYGELTPAHLTMMYYLDLDGARITTLADRAGMTKQSMSAIVRSLEDQGYVERAPDKDDGRASIIQYTETGRQFLADTYRMKVAIDAAYTEILGSADFDGLVDALARLLGEDDMSM